MTLSWRAELNVWMVRLADGDRTMMEKVYPALQPPVYRFCFKMLSDASASDEVTQQVLLQVFRNASDFDRNGDVLTWAFSLAYWECRSALRRRSRELARSPGDLQGGAEEFAFDESALGQIELRDALATALSQLSESERETILKSVEGIHLNAAERKRKQRILARLRRWWKRELHGI